MMLPRRRSRSLRSSGETEDGHDLGGDGDVEAVLAREAVGDAAQRVDDRAQRAIVHVEHALPSDAARVEAEAVAPVDVIVDHRRQQIVRRRDGVEVAGEVQVDVLHRHHLRIAAAGGAALDAEARPERGLAQAHHRLLADAVETVAETDGRRRLAFAGRGRRDGGDENELAVLGTLQAVDVLEGDLGFCGAVGNERFGRDGDLGGHLGDGLHRRGAGDLNVRLDRHGSRSSQKCSSWPTRWTHHRSRQNFPAPILAVRTASASLGCIGEPQCRSAAR